MRNFIFSLLYKERFRLKRLQMYVVILIAQAFAEIFSNFFALKYTTR